FGMSSLRHTTTPSASAMTRSPSLTATPARSTVPPTEPGPRLADATGVVPRPHTGKPSAATSRESRISPSVTTPTTPAASSSRATRSPRIAVRDSMAPATTRTAAGDVTAAGTSRIGWLSSVATCTTRAGAAIVASGESARIHVGSAAARPAASAASVLDSQSGVSVTPPILPGVSDTTRGCSACGDCCDPVWYPLGAADIRQSAATTGAVDLVFAAKHWRPTGDRLDGMHAYRCDRFDPESRLCTA